MAAAAAAKAIPAKGVKFRPPDIQVQQQQTQHQQPGYRNISLYTNDQAMAEMRRLCNADPLEKVYDLGGKLGSGSGGTVYQATHRSTGDRAAVKNIDLTSGEKKVHLLMEVQVMRELRHKNLVAFTDIFLSQR